MLRIKYRYENMPEFIIVIEIKEERYTKENFNKKAFETQNEVKVIEVEEITKE